MGTSNARTACPLTNFASADTGSPVGPVRTPWIFDSETVGAFATRENVGCTENAACPGATSRGAMGPWSPHVAEATNAPPINSERSHEPLIDRQAFNTVTSSSPQPTNRPFNGYPTRLGQPT